MGEIELEHGEQQQPMFANGAHTTTAGGNGKEEAAMEPMHIESGIILRNKEYENGLKRNKQAQAVHDNDLTTFIKHFNALFIKRVIYGKRDRRMVICQLILPVILVIIGLAILLASPDYTQPSLVLSPNKYNPDYISSSRNFVPIYRDSDCDMCAQIENQFHAASSHISSDGGVNGIAQSVNTATATGVWGGTSGKEADPFGGCSQGPEPLFNMSRYLIDPPTEDKREQDGTTVYGALSFASGTNTSQLVYHAMINGSAVHGVGIYTNLAHTAYLQVLTGVNTASITTRNHPLPETYRIKTQAAAGDAFVVALFTMIAFCFIPASFAVFVVREREIKAKHQQIISGVSLSAYWTSTFVWDTLSYLPTALLVLAIIYAFGIDAYTQGDGVGALATVLILFGPSVAAFTYLTSFAFDSHSTAQVMVMFCNFIVGLCLSIVSFVLMNISSTSSISPSLRYLFRIFPAFCFGETLIMLTLCDKGQTCPTIDDNGLTFAKVQGPFDWDIAGANIVFMTIEIVFYFGCTLLVEYVMTFPWIMSWLSTVHDPGIKQEVEDEDVKAETQRVQSGLADHDVVRIANLRKVYHDNSGGSCKSRRTESQFWYSKG